MITMIQYSAVFKRYDPNVKGGAVSVSRHLSSLNHRVFDNGARKYFLIILVAVFIESGLYLDSVFYYEYRIVLAQ